MARNDTDRERRHFLHRLLQGAGLLALSGCDRLYENETFRSVLESAASLNRGVQHLLTPENKLAQEFAEKDISPYFRPNGNPPPAAAAYRRDAAEGWRAYRLDVTGLVQHPRLFSLAELRALPARTQITRHDCVEGWSAIAKWRGVPLARIVEQVQPAAAVRYVVFHCMDASSRGNPYYESIDMRDAVHPQTILAYDMNDKPVPVANGAPLRLRVENQLGYKHAKYIRALEFVAALDDLHGGKGGYWEDRGYAWYAGI